MFNRIMESVDYLLKIKIYCYFTIVIIYVVIIYGVGFHKMLPFMSICLKISWHGMPPLIT